MKQTLFSLIIFLAGLTLLHGQKTDEDYTPDPSSSAQKNKPRFIDRIVIGGNLGASFGTFTFVQIAPQVGYRVTEKWTTGVGANYMYFSSPGYVGQAIYGGSVWSNYVITGGLFATTTYEVLNRNVYEPPLGLHRRNVNVWLVGAGYYSGGESGLGIGIQILYDLIGDPWSPYQNPQIRGGLLFGFN